MTKHKVGTQEEWAATVNELHEREQELGKLDEELAKQRQELPWVPVEKEYTFATDEGTKTLEQLFEGRSQLLAYNISSDRATATARAQGARIWPITSTAASST
jgi:predicted dithiol-disulfide oxidoreductase (DUF899 family)